jgi:thiamine biosynthesis lipoprotein
MALTLCAKENFYCAEFSAMASPCEVLIETHDKSLAMHLASMAQQEALRIERKYSRYRTDNLMYAINHQASPVVIDEETHRLLEFADTCYQLSQGLFDITSGVLRKAWKFDGSDNIPSQAVITPLLKFVGWKKVKFSSEMIHLPPGFELDFGGIGKEYAVDRVATKLQQTAKETSVLVNFGGDIQVTCPRQNNAPWFVGIENPLTDNQGQSIVKIFSGGLATSGDARRFLQKDNQRYSHILDPTTGYPVIKPPRSVTVASANCTQAGLLATLTLLQGEGAETFIKQQGVTHWIYR